MHCVFLQVCGPPEPLCPDLHAALLQVEEDFVRSTHLLLAKKDAATQQVKYLTYDSLEQLLQSICNVVNFLKLEPLPDGRVAIRYVPTDGGLTAMPRMAGIHGKDPHQQEQQQGQQRQQQRPRHNAWKMVQHGATVTETKVVRRPDCIPGLGATAAMELATIKGASEQAAAGGGGGGTAANVAPGVVPPESNSTALSAEALSALAAILPSTQPLSQGIGAPVVPSGSFPGSQGQVPYTAGPSPMVAQGSFSPLVPHGVTPAVPVVAPAIASAPLPALPWPVVAQGSFSPVVGPAVVPAVPIAPLSLGPVAVPAGGMGAEAMPVPPASHGISAAAAAEPIQMMVSAPAGGGNAGLPYGMDGGEPWQGYHNHHQQQQQQQQMTTTSHATVPAPVLPATVGAQFYVAALPPAAGGSVGGPRPMVRKSAQGAPPILPQPPPPPRRAAVAAAEGGGLRSAGCSLLHGHLEGCEQAADVTAPRTEENQQQQGESQQNQMYQQQQGNHQQEQHVVNPTAADVDSCGGEGSRQRQGQEQQAAAEQWDDGVGTEEGGNAVEQADGMEEDSEEEFFDGGEDGDDGVQENLWSLPEVEREEEEEVEGEQEVQST